MNEHELTVKVEICNENILRFAREYVDAYLCDEMDSKNVDLKKAAEIVENPNIGEHTSKSELAKFGILLFWFKARNFYSKELLVLFEEAC